MSQSSCSFGSSVLKRGLQCQSTMPDCCKDCLISFKQIGRLLLRIRDLFHSYCAVASACGISEIKAEGASVAFPRAQLNRLVTGVLPVKRTSINCGLKPFGMVQRPVRRS